MVGGDNRLNSNEVVSRRWSMATQSITGQSHTQSHLSLHTAGQEHGRSTTLFVEMLKSSIQWVPSGWDGRHIKREVYKKLYILVGVLLLGPGPKNTKPPDVLGPRVCVICGPQPKFLHLGQGPKYTP